MCLKSLTKYLPSKGVPGLKLDKIDDRLAQYDLIFDAPMGGETELGGGGSKDWSKYFDDFFPQYKYPTCVAVTARNVKRAVQKAQGIANIEISPWHLFSSIPNSMRGSYPSDALTYLKGSGAVLERDKPYPGNGDYVWNWTGYKRFIYDGQRIPANARDEMGNYKVEGFSWVNPYYKSLLKDALNHSPLLMAVRMTKDWYNDFVDGRGWTEYLHLVSLKAIDSNGCYHIHDSLSSFYGFNGNRILDKDYPYILSAYSIRDLPDDWKERQKNWLYEEFKVCVNHYGQLANPDKEREMAKILQDKFKKFNNQSVYEAAGRFWVALVNAVVYGNYSYTDAINFVYHWRRTGEYVFNLNKPRS